MSELKLNSMRKDLSPQNKNHNWDLKRYSQILIKNKLTASKSIDSGQKVSPIQKDEPV